MGDYVTEKVMYSNVMKGIGLALASIFFATAGFGLDEAEFRVLQDQFHGALKEIDAGNLDSGCNTLASIYVELKEIGDDSRHSAEVGLELAEAYHRLVAYDQEQAVLEEIFDGYPDDDLLLRAALLQAELHVSRRRDTDAYAVLAALETKIHRNEWPGSGRSLYAEVSQRLNQHWQQQVMHAERLFDAGFYSEAVPLYGEVYEAAVDGVYPEASSKTGKPTKDMLIELGFRFAQALYLAEDYDSVIKVLVDAPKRVPIVFKNPSSRIVDIERNTVYLLALAYSRAGRYQEAIKSFRSYMHSGPDARLQHYDEVRWELGKAHYLVGNNEEARGFFEGLDNKYVERSLRERVSIYLARLDIAEGSMDHAKQRLAAFGQSVKSGHPLLFEAAYLRGQIAYLSGEYSAAVEAFGEALPARNKERAPWHGRALYHQAWSHLRLADASPNDFAGQKNHFDRAEQIFKQLLAEAPKDQELREKATLALARTLFKRGVLVGDDNASAAIDSLLASADLSSERGWGQALLMRGEVANSYAKRREIYQQLTEGQIEDQSLLAEGWYRQGLNEFEEAQRLDELGELTTSRYRQASEAFTAAAKLFAYNDASRAGDSMYYQAHATFLLGGDEHAYAAFTLLQNLVHDRRDHLLAMDDPAKAYYLLGMVAHTLGDKHAAVAEQSMMHIIASHASSAYADDALAFLGAYYFEQEKYSKAKQMYLKLTTDYARSSRAGEALFWAAECASWLGDDEEAVRDLRSRVFVDYPTCCCAAEAYFRCYTFAEYLNSSDGALQHLHRMPNLFTNSPFIVNAYYLIGLDYKRDKKDVHGKILRRKDLSAAIDAFDRAAKAFDTCLVGELISEEQRPGLTTIRYRSMLEGAMSNIAIADGSSGAKRQIYLEYARDLLEGLLDDFDGANTILPPDAMAAIRDEAEYGLAQAYIRSKDDRSAEALLTGMLERFAAKKINRGYYLSRVWHDLGLIAARRNDHELAVQFFIHANEAGNGVLTAEQRLGLWISQADSYRALKELDAAMTVLSKVINDSAVSGLRVKAMYLRAEIYEEQDRHELAVKQLEATANKGGEWAQQAEERLEKEYGYR